MKKGKRKSMHKSTSNDHRKSVSKEKKLNGIASCKKIGGLKGVDGGLNYQRRGKHEKEKEREKEREREKQKPKQPKKVKEEKHPHVHSKEVPPGKIKSAEKSETKPISKKLSSGKLR